VSRAKEDSLTKNEQDREIETGDAGTEVGMTDDPLTRYRAKEAMTPAKEHEQTVVKTDPGSENRRARTSWNKFQRGSRKSQKKRYDKRNILCHQNWIQI
jgi:hypothetical protein